MGAFDLPPRIGRYVLGPVLGAGAFAVVVRALDEGLEADVALKVLTPRHARDPEVRERFVREGRMLRRVRNPAVVTVHDVGETPDGRPFLVMELAAGGAFGDRVDPALCPVDDMTLHHVVTTLAEGLGALHAAGVVHRDVKPANLLVLRDRTAAPPPGPADPLVVPGERIVVADLGLAKDQLATAYGPTMVGGTLGYLAPEQAEVGAPVDARADVYAATAVLWFLLTGRQPPPPGVLVAGAAPPAWNPVLSRGLAGDARARFPAMDAWAEAALSALAASASTTPGGVGAAGPAPATPPVPPPPARVEMRGPDGGGGRALTGIAHSIGRTAANDIALPRDGQVSRLHAVLERLGGGWCVRDLGSRNGTFVNGERVGGVRALRHGDEVRVGETYLTYRQEQHAMDHTRTAAAARDVVLDAGERGLLVALVWLAGARPPLADAATTSELAALLRTDAATVRARLDDLCARFGVDPGASDRAARLADEAVRRGAVTTEELRRAGLH